MMMMMMMIGAAAFSLLSLLLLALLLLYSTPFRGTHACTHVLLGTDGGRAKGGRKERKKDYFDC